MTPTIVGDFCVNGYKVYFSLTSNDLSYRDLAYVADAFIFRLEVDEVLKEFDARASK